MTAQDLKTLATLTEKDPEAWFRFFAGFVEWPGLVLTLAEVAALLRVPEEIVTAEAEAGRLPGRKLGTEWRFARPAIVEWLKAGRPPSGESVAKTSKERMLAVYGAWKDFGEDPEQVIEELSRARKATSAKKG
jgi:excisionase family DNA binding protein